MDVKIHKPRYDQAVAVIPDRISAEAKRKRLVNSVNLAVSAHKISVFTYGKLCLAFTVNTFISPVSFLIHRMMRPSLRHTYSQPFPAAGRDVHPIMNLYKYAILFVTVQPERCGLNYCNISM